MKNIVILDAETLGDVEIENLKSLAMLFVMIQQLQNR